MSTDVETRAMAMLTAADHEFLREQGYLRVPGVVQAENCRAVVDAMFEFLGFDRNNPADWYRPPLREKSGGMVELYHHQSLWDNRQHPRVYQLFCELFNETRLHVSMDRVSFKVPDRSAEGGFTEMGFLHLDMDPRGSTCVPLHYQGLISLTDAGVDQGTFHCVPGFHRKIQEWIATPAARRPADPPDFSQIEPTPIAVKTGDMIVWNLLLPHGSGRNRTPRPRMVQYVFMSPAGRYRPEDLTDRLRRWRERRPTFAGDERKLDERGEPATLTPLGRKLLGLDPWN